MPSFPHFKKISLDDREMVQAVTRTFPPYSDFNFTSLWSWDLKKQIALSELNKNLVVQFTDYLTDEIFYSFLGSQHVNETASTILEYCKAIKIQPLLRLVPEASIYGINSQNFTLQEDRDNFDYLYRTDELARYPGALFAKKRNHVRSFLKQFPSVTSRAISVKDKHLAAQMYELLANLAERRLLQTGMTNSHDCAVLEHLIGGSDYFTLTSVGVFIDDRLAAFMISEIIDGTHALGHIMAANTDYSSGIYTFLMMINAQSLLERNVSFFNFEQDLGIENLRTAKMRFRPTSFLKKYTLGYSHHTQYEAHGVI